MNRIIWGFGAATAGIAAGTIGMVLWVGLRDASAAGWVQAGGSIWAVLAAGYLAWQQGETERLRQAAEKAGAASAAEADALEKSKQTAGIIFLVANDTIQALREIDSQILTVGVADVARLRAIDDFLMHFLANNFGEVALEHAFQLRVACADLPTAIQEYRVGQGQYPVLVRHACLLANRVKADATELFLAVGLDVSPDALQPFVFPPIEDSRYTGWEGQAK